MEIEGYVTLCFGVPTTSVGVRLTPITPSSLPLLPIDQVEVWAARKGCYTMFWGPQHLCQGKGLGSELGAKGSEPNIILGFRVPITCGGKNFDDHI